MATTLPRVGYGWIGIGNMGYGMAMNMATKIPPGAQLNVCDINETVVEKFLAEAKSKGLVVRALAIPKEVAEHSEVILMSLPAGPQVLEVVTHQDTGLLAADGNKPRLFIDTSTIDVPTSLEVGKSITAASTAHRFLDAPVSGGIPVAAAGKLSVMCGGEDAAFAEAKPILDLFAIPENVFHCGQAGAGLATKQINNYVAFISFLALCEGLNTGVRYGLDPVLLSKIINVSSGMCWNSVHMNPIKGVSPNSSANKDFKGGFPTELAKGVIDMAIDLGEYVAAKSVLAASVKGVFAKAVDNPKTKGQECRSVWRLFSENDGHDLD